MTDATVAHDKFLARPTGLPTKSFATAFLWLAVFLGGFVFYEPAPYDLFYIENWSVIFDLYILLLTPFRLFNSENAF